MSARSIYLVYGYDIYEFPCQPIKAFYSENQAKAFVGIIDAYQAKRPTYPGDAATDQEFEAWELLLDRWKKSHPDPDSKHRDGFDVMTIELEEKP